MLEQHLSKLVSPIEENISVKFAEFFYLRVIGGNTGHENKQFEYKIFQQPRPLV